MENLIRAERERRGWTQAVLAEHLHVSRRTVVALETGRYDPSLPLAFRISRLFDRAIEDLFIPAGHDAPRSTKEARRGGVDLPVR